MDISNISREVLVKQYEESKAKFETANKALMEDFAKLFNEWLVAQGIDSFCSFRAEDDGDGELVVTVGNERHDIYVRYYKRWKDDGAARYELTMNYSSLGTFSSSDEVHVKYASVIGKLASDLTKLQTRLSRLNWVHVRELQRIYYRAEEALDAYDDEVANAEHDRKVAEVMPYIKVGGKFFTERKYFDTHKPVVVSIVCVNRKYIDFDYVSKRMTRNEIADKVISGKWKVCK